MVDPIILPIIPPLESPFQLTGQDLRTLFQNRIALLLSFVLLCPGKNHDGAYPMESLDPGSLGMSPSRREAVSVASNSGPVPRLPSAGRCRMKGAGAVVAF